MAARSSEYTIPHGWLFKLTQLDTRVLSWVATWRTPSLVQMMRGIANTADASVITAGLAVGMLKWPGRHAALVTLATVLAVGISSVAKRLCGRSRPTNHAVQAAPDRFSMPSGHSTCAWALAITVSVLVPAAALPVVLWAIAVSASRIILGVHYPFDVLVGALLGTFAAVTTFYLSAVGIV
jgi:undecaprenyl-diphosphatase